MVLPGIGSFITSPQALSIQFIASATSEDIATVTGPAGITAGDLLVLFDVAHNGSSTNPTKVIPTGFTEIGTAIDTENANRLIMAASYKIADGTEASASITGMDDTNERKILLVFRVLTGIAISSVTAEDVEDRSDSLGDPAPLMVNSGSGDPPLIVFGAWCAIISATLTPRTFTPAADGEVGVSTDFYVKYKIYNAEPQDTIVDMDDLGVNFDETMLSFYLVTT